MGPLRTTALFSGADTLGCNLITDVKETARLENPLIMLTECGQEVPRGETQKRTREKIKE